MSLPNPTITAFLDLPSDGGSFWVLDHPTKSTLGTSTTLAGDLGTNLTDTAYDIVIRRGRSNELDDIGPGACSVRFHNYDRRFDGLNTDGDYYGYLKPGALFNVKVHDVTIFEGYVDDWDLEYDVTGGADATMPGIDALGLLARREFDDWTTTPQQSGERVEAILARPEASWMASKRLVDEGIEPLQADNVSWGSNVLNYLQLVAQSELGALFASRDGVLTFRDRHSLTSPVPSTTFSDRAIGLPFHGGTLASPGERYYNRVGIDRTGGTLQTVEDAATTGTQGVRSFTRRSLLMATDAASLAMAQHLFNLYNDPAPRVETITVNVSALPAASCAQVVALDIYDAVRVVWTPLGVGSEIDELMSIEGIDHSIPCGGPHLMTMSLAPITQTSVFTLDDPVLGRLDGPGRLAF